MSSAAPRSVTIALGAGPADASTVAALKLVDAAARRGHDVTVYAYGEAVRLGAASCPASGYVRGLLRDHPGTDDASRQEGAAGDASHADGRPDRAAHGDDQADDTARRDDVERGDNVTPGRAIWIVDGQDPRTAPQVDGVRLGDGSDLWRAVRDSDVVLGVTP